MQIIKSIYMSIHLTALVKSKPGTAESMKPLLAELVKGSLKEEACQQYELYHSVEDENLFIFHETWKDESGLDAHNHGPNITQFIKDSSAILDGSIIIYKTEKVS